MLDLETRASVGPVNILAPALTCRNLLILTQRLQIRLLLPRLLLSLLILQHWWGRWQRCILFRHTFVPDQDRRNTSYSQNRRIYDEH